MTNTTQAQEKKYFRFDINELEEGMKVIDVDYEIETFEEMKQFLVDFWNEDFYGGTSDLTEEEHKKLVEEILAVTDLSELDDRLGGIGWSYCDMDEDGNPIWEEMTTTLTCTCEQDAKSQEKFFTDHGACQVCVYTSEGK